MKIGYFADGPWSHRALERIAQDDCLQVVFIVPRYDSQDPALREWAIKLEVDYLPLRNVNNQESINLLKEYGADLFVSMSFDQIIKQQLLEVAPFGFINCHAGALPFYRGRNVLNWVLINDEDQFGVTVHYIDEGIDTGNIILQKLSPISDKDDYASLLQRATEICAELLYEVLVMFEKGNVVSIPQASIDPVGFYCGKRIEGDEWIDWSCSSRQIFNFIRAICPPGPCAHALLEGNEIKIKRAMLVNGVRSYIGTPGEVVGVYKESIMIKTGDSIISVECDDMFPLLDTVRIGMRFQDYRLIKFHEVDRATYCGA